MGLFSRSKWCPSTGSKTRKGSILQFLYESKLIEKGKSIIALSGAKLSKADLYGANLYEANLSGADLFRAALSGANLYEADLSGADLSGADLSYAKLNRADLSEAIITQPQLDVTRSLEDALLPDGSRHP